jgi:hypothetical protein
MSYEIINASRGRVTLRVVGTGSVSIELADLVANTVSAQNTHAIVEEIVSRAIITQAHWAANTGNAYWSVKRNTTEILQLPGTGAIPFNTFGMTVANTATANIVIDLVNGGSGTLILELTKDATYSPAIE